MYDADENEYKDYLNRLGNLTILLDKANIKARNKNFSDKKDYYNKSRLYITNSLAKYDNWNYEQIEKRQEQLYELAKNIWKV
ncbi:HNH endonuclease family protein [Acinetobacter towneri]|nr:HNH endonuclease family protein [Acinetobacter towneri]MCO8054518.1 HNH endonuclease family protein [Acinetobacter towneri]